MCEAIRILLEESRQEGIEQQKIETEFQMRRADEAIEQWRDAERQLHDEKSQREDAERQILSLKKELESLKKQLSECSS